MNTTDTLTIVGLLLFILRDSWKIRKLKREKINIVKELKNHIRYAQLLEERLGMPKSDERVTDRLVALNEPVEPRK